MSARCRPALARDEQCELAGLTGAQGPHHFENRVLDLGAAHRPIFEIGHADDLAVHLCIGDSIHVDDWDSSVVLDQRRIVGLDQLQHVGLVLDCEAHYSTLAGWHCRKGNTIHACAPERDRAQQKYHRHVGTFAPLAARTALAQSQATSPSPYVIARLSAEPTSATNASAAGGSHSSSAIAAASPCASARSNNAIVTVPASVSDAIADVNTMGSINSLPLVHVASVRGPDRGRVNLPADPARVAASI